MGAELQTFREEFASLCAILGARYDGSPLTDTDGFSPPPDHRAKCTPRACPGGGAPHCWIGDKVSLLDQHVAWHAEKGEAIAVLNAAYGRSE